MGTSMRVGGSHSVSRPGTVGTFLRKIKRRVDAFLGRKKLSAARQWTPLKLIIGASGTSQAGWVATNVAYLNLLKASDWEQFFEPHSIAAIVAEHVWEHLTPAEGLIAAKRCFHYLKRGGHLRIAVPDGNHPDPEYIEWVRIGGVGDGADDHKVLYRFQSLSEVLERAGFDVRLLEYFDESGQFRHQEWDANDGFIRRSMRHDPRNVNGHLKYTSLIIDGVVPAAVHDQPLS